MRSKEDLVVEPFFNSSKHWHFDELHKKIGISKPQLSSWLKKLEKDRIIRRVKEGGKAPYYVQVFESKTYQHRKRMFALKKMAESGFLSHLAELPKARVVIVFGSFSRSDWYDNSDIDVFIYGSDDMFEQGKYESMLNREIQLHIAKDKKDLKRKDKMLPYIISGDFIKGSIEDLDVTINAKA